jgi:hypothetical protein
MADVHDPIVEVREGQIRVLVARMGAGKSEQALRWLEEGLEAAREDDEVEIPIWLGARDISGGLESEVEAAIGRDPVRSLRIVIDDLDSVGPKRAEQLLIDAREFVKVWTRTTVLATSRPGALVNESELLRVEPWPTERGAGLLYAVAGENVPSGIWSHETVELLASPLSVLGLAARLRAGGDTNVSRVQLLSDLAETIIRSRHADQATDETWSDLARLAVRILGSPSPVPASTFARPPRIRQLTETDLVVNDDGVLTFALPLFEQHFGAEAIRLGIVDLESAVDPRAFPRWRYAVASAISTSVPHVQEELMVQLARTNPAAAFWILGELAPRNAYTDDWRDLTSAGVVDLIRRRRRPGQALEPNSSILAATWLREALQAVLDGLGPLAEQLASYHDGRVVQWGARLDAAYLSLAEARQTAPPPEIIQLNSYHPEITIASGWQSWTIFPFPQAEYGRWLWAQRRLRERLLKLIKLRTLPAPRTSRLARERLWYLGEFVMKFGNNKPTKVIELGALREKVAEWMVKSRTQ